MYLDMVSTVFTSEIIHGRSKGSSGFVSDMLPGDDSEISDTVTMN